MKNEPGFSHPITAAIASELVVVLFIALLVVINSGSIAQFLAQ